MSNTTTGSKPTSRLMARWERPATERWQELHTQLSAAIASDASRWSRRSFVSCRWHELPPGVSALSQNGTV